MNSQRYTPEFKDEAVRQMPDRGHPVADVAERLGVSAHNLYKWGKAAKEGSLQGKAPARVPTASASISNAT